MKDLISGILAKELNVKESQVITTINLIDEGNTIPFIARYRKEATGGLSDTILRDLFDRLTYLRNLNERKDEVIRLIEEQGQLTEKLKKDITEALVLQRVEDLYRPYKKKKSTRASKAKEKGLQPFADMVLAQNQFEGDLNAIAETYINEELGVKTVKDVFAGGKDIIAESISDNPEFRGYIRTQVYKSGVVLSEATDKEEKTVYEMYYEYHEGVSKVANHRVLALNRGEKDKKLKVKITMPVEMIEQYLEKAVLINENSLGHQLIAEAIKDGFKRLIGPAIEREIRNLLTERAEEDAIKVFAQNTKNLLMTSPVKDIKVMAIDPSFRTGCKITMLDGTGKLLDYVTIYPNAPQNKVVESRKITKALLEKYETNVIAIGNGTASRETEQFVADTLKEMDREIHYTIVSEAGASVYSASKLAAEEYPDIDVSTRGALSIGRRLQDPLAELVKIDPKHIGVGQYQHDLNQGKLDGSLKNVVEDCVNSVGVDLNTASPSLLQYISGVSMSIAKNIVKYREENGKFSNRKELKKVARLGDKAFEQAAGFLRISDGANALDNTGVHPESYGATEQLVKALDLHIDDIKLGQLAEIDEKIINYAEYEPPQKKKTNQKVRSLKDMMDLKASMNLKDKATDRRELLKRNLEKVAEEIGIGVMTLKDIIKELEKPGRDPRDDKPTIIFRNDVLKIEDLKLDMELTGTVRNVVNFGAFVDIGIKQDGLVHISEISDKYIKNPMEVVSVGDTVNVRIIDIDLERDKVALSMKKLKG